jgi:hypothetical protein
VAPPVRRRTRLEEKGRRKSKSFLRKKNPFPRWRDRGASRWSADDVWRRREKGVDKTGLLMEGATVMERVLFRTLKKMR